jgi:VIT1/CCC1 family predicted Fe2+/Mn2+ transporter
MDSRRAAFGQGLTPIAAVMSYLIARFAAGADKSLITIRSRWSSGLEMTFLGAIEGAVTYTIGFGIGRISECGLTMLLRLACCRIPIE